MENLGKILPVDGFRAKLATSLPSDYVQSLTHLYQPLLGIEAISLYQLLISEISFQLEAPDHHQTHHTLMNYLNIPLNRVYEARMKLEGIGLLNTYKLEKDGAILYTYEIIPPFCAKDFFNDMMLAELLYRQVGKARFELLQGLYIKSEKINKGENITAGFHDVYQTFQPSDYYHIPIENEEIATGIDIEPVETSWVRQILEQKQIPATNIVTDESLRILSQLKNLYDLESYELEKALIWSLTAENKLDVEQLKAACHDLFSAKHNVANVKLTYKHSNVAKAPRDKPLSQRDQLIERLEKISPKQLLEDHSKGNNASEQDMQVVRDVMVSQGLPIPVMNVLIHYVLLQSNNKLPKAYLEKIASHWSRVGLKTAREAMDFALKEVKPKAKQPRRNYQTRTSQKEIVPDWFKDRNEKQSNSNEATPLTEKQLQEQREMEAILQKYGQKK